VAPTPIGSGPPCEKTQTKEWHLGAPLENHHVRGGIPGILVGNHLGKKVPFAAKTSSSHGWLALIKKNPRFSYIIV